MSTALQWWADGGATSSHGPGAMMSRSCEKKILFNQKRCKKMIAGLPSEEIRILCSMLVCFVMSQTSSESKKFVEIVFFANYKRKHPP